MGKEVSANWVRIDPQMSQVPLTLFSMVTIKLLLCKPSKKLAKGNKETENILGLLCTQDILAYFWRAPS